MELLVDGAQVLAVDVGVDLRRGDVGVAEHLLHGAQVGAALQQVGGEGVAERVGRDVLLDSGSLDVLLQDLPGAHAGEGRAAGVEQQDPLPLPRLQPGAHLAEVDGHGADGSAPDRHQPLFAALAEDANQAVLHQDVAHPEGDPLGDAEPGAVAQLQEGAVAEDERVVQRRGGQESGDLVHRQDVGERPPAPGRVEALAGVADDVPFAQEEPVVGADGGDVSPDRRRREPEVLQVVDVLAKRPRADLHRRPGAAHAHEDGEALEVAPVRLVGLRRGALLQRQKLLESLQEKGARDVVRRARRGAHAARFRRTRKTAAAITTSTTAPMPIQRPTCATRAESSSHEEPTRKARYVMIPYQSPDGSAIATMARKAGTRRAPAKGGTTARTAGRKRLMTIAQMPRRLYSDWSRASAPAPPPAIFRSTHSAPKRRPSAYMNIAPATLPTHVERKDPTALPCPRAAMKLPNATTVSAGSGGKMFSAAAVAARARYRAAGGRDVSQSRRPWSISRPHPPYEARGWRRRCRPAPRRGRPSPSPRWSCP